MDKNHMKGERPDRHDRQERLFYLDVIRMASAILIVVYHFSLSLTLSFGARSVDILHATVNGSWGMAPVYCFFMVSGASLMHRYGVEERLNLARFYKKRFLSIYPLFWIAYVLGFFAVFWQLKGLYDVPTWSLIWSVLGIDGWIVNWVPTFYMVGEWFLGSIILLYLLFPAVRVLWRRSPGWTMAAISLAAGVLFWYHPFPMDIKQDPVIDLFYFLLGAWIERMRSQMDHLKEQHPQKLLAGMGHPGKASTGSAKAFGTLKALLWAASLGTLALWVFVPMTDPLPAMELTVSAQAFGLPMFLRQSFILLTTCAFYLFLMGGSGWLEKILSPEDRPTEAQAAASEPAGAQAAASEPTGARSAALRPIGTIKNRIRGAILAVSGKSYGVFLTHHMVSQVLCGHFAGINLSPREVLTLLALVFLVTWCMTLLIYRIWSYIKEG